MRIASFNVESLFCRAVALNLKTWQQGKQILEKYRDLNTLLQESMYTSAIKTKILATVKDLGLSKSDESNFVILRQNRGRLLNRPKSGPPQVVADGRDAWVGWLELKTEAVDEVATQMTARVIKDVGADILAVIEADNRIGLVRFNDQLLKPLQATYASIMLIDGNDDRGIDVGFLTKPGYAIESIVSHVDDLEGGKLIFSRDCPEYTVRINDTTRVLVLVNHLKSKGYGSQSDSNARRKVQATRVREIYDLRKSQEVEMIAIVGDFNDTPESDALAPLLSDGSDLKDIFKHPKFQSDGRPGTYANGTESNKIDYILLSPALWARVEKGGVWRKGVWGGKNGTLFPHYPEMTNSVQAASDHAAIWADVNL